jgi:hypothetical protein
MIDDRSGVRCQLIDDVGETEISRLQDIEG